MRLSCNATSTFIKVLVWIFHNASPRKICRNISGNQWLKQQQLFMSLILFRAPGFSSSIFDLLLTTTPECCSITNYIPLWRSKYSLISVFGSSYVKPSSYLNQKFVAKLQLYKSGTALVIGMPYGNSFLFFRFSIPCFS